MKTAISDLAARLSTFFGDRLKQILAVGLASVMLLGSVACSPTSQASVGTGSYGERIAQPTNEKTYQPSEKLASYDDYEAGRDTKATQAKAKALVDRAKQNVNQVDDLGDLVDEVKSGTANPARDAGDVITDATDRAARDAKAGFSNLKKNLSNAGDELEDVAQDAKQNAAQAGKEVKRSAEDVADYAKDKA